MELFVEGTIMAKFNEKPCKVEVYTDEYRAEVQICLNCPYPRCRHGYCDRIREYEEKNNANKIR